MSGGGRAAGGVTIVEVGRSSEPSSYRWRLRPSTSTIALSRRWMDRGDGTRIKIRAARGLADPCQPVAAAACRPGDNDGRSAALFPRKLADHSSEERGWAIDGPT